MGNCARLEPSLSWRELLELGDDQLHVWGVRLDAGPQVVDCLVGQLSTDERNRAGRFRFDRDGRRFSVARAVLRTLVGRYTRTAPRAIRFAYGEFGRPELAEPSIALRFNVAHSGGLAVYAFASGGAVGIDVEAVRRLPEAQSLARRFFSPRECADLQLVAEPDRARAFYSCWTRKEAFVKALGTGLLRPLDSFDVSLRPDQPAILRSVAGDPGETDRWSLFGFEPASGVIGAVAMRRRQVQMTFRGLHSVDELIAS